MADATAALIRPAMSVLPPDDFLPGSASQRSRSVRLFASWRGARDELRADANVELLLHTLGGAVLHRVFVDRKRADTPWIRSLVRMVCAGVNAVGEPDDERQPLESTPKHRRS